MGTAEGELVLAGFLVAGWLWVLVVRRRSVGRPGRSVSVLTGVAVTLFASQAGLAAVVLGSSLLVAVDGAVWSWFVAHRRSDLTVLAAAADVLGGTAAMAGLTVVVVVVLLGVRRVAVAVVAAAVPAVAGLLVVLDKAGYGRVRPPAGQQLIVETNGSLPSGHTVGTTVVLGILVVVGCRTVRARAGRVGLVVAGTVAAAVVGTSRLYLGVHWFSDVVDDGCWAGRVSPQVRRRCPGGLVDRPRSPTSARGRRGGCGRTGAARREPGW